MIRLAAAALAALLLAACDRAPAPEPEAALAWQPGLDCGARATLGNPRKLAETPLRLDAAGCAFTAVTAAVDMPNMPMAVAPVTLRRDGDAWTGALTFTMSGPWYVEIRAVDAQGAEHVSRHDLSVP